MSCLTQYLVTYYITYITWSWQFHWLQKAVLRFVNKARRYQIGKMFAQKSNKLHSWNASKYIKYMTKYSKPPACTSIDWCWKQNIQVLICGGYAHLCNYFNECHNIFKMKHLHSSKSAKYVHMSMSLHVFANVELSQTHSFLYSNPPGMTLNVFHKPSHTLTL